LYGNASGGVIRVTSELGAAEPLVEARLGTGEYGYRKLQLKAAGEAGDLAYLVNLSDLDFDGYREHSEAENRQANIRLRYALGPRTDLDTSLHVTDQPVANDPGGIDRAQAEADPRSARDANVAFAAGEALEQTRLGLRLRHDMASAGSLVARNYYTWRDFDGLLPFENGGAVEIDRLFAGAGVQYTLAHGLGGWPAELVTGIDYDRQDDDRRRFDNLAGVRGALTLDQNELVTSAGVYAQERVALTDAVELTLGLRHDRVRFDVSDRFLADGDDSGDVTLTETSPMAGLTVQVSDALNLYASVATAFETPTTTELANPSAAGGFNPALDPQLATSYEIGARGEFAGRHRYSAAVFHVDVDDELVPFELAAFPGRDFFANAGSSQRRGIELSWRSDLGAGWSASGAYTYSDFEFDTFVDDNGNDFSGNTIPGTPRHLVNATLDYQHPRGAFFTLESLYVDRLPANNANSAFADAYTLANLRGGFESSAGDWLIAPFVGVSNVFNASYAGNVRINAFGGRYFEPGPARMAYAGVRVRFRRR
jgi:iron complex outermembrane receptor protein